MNKESEFDWDDEKAAANGQKHGVGFDEAQSVFGDPMAVTVYDEAHSVIEDRFVTVGFSKQGRLLAVSHTDEGTSEDIRIISARLATKQEAKQYAQNQGRQGGQ